MKPFVRGDLEGFFVLGIQVLLDLLLMRVLLIGFLGFSETLFYSRILPAAAMGMIAGNIFYAWQALKLAREEGRDDATAIPFGTSALVSIVFVYLIMGPVQQRALADGMTKEAAELIAWHAGIIACVGSGVVEFTGSFVAQKLQNIVPRPALLVAIGGTGLTFVGLDFLFRSFAFPIVGLPAVMLVLILFIGGSKMRFKLPSGLVILGFGVFLVWMTRLTGWGAPIAVSSVDFHYVGFYLPIPVIWEVVPSLGYLMEFLPIILPIGFIFLIGSLQNIESAAAAGDNYKPRPLLLMNGVGTLVSAFFGSPFPATIFLGHAGYKKIGARAGYSTLNAIVWGIVCLTGTLSLVVAIIPIEAGMALVLFVGIVVCAQSFEATDRRYTAAVVVGLLPALASYVGLVTKHSLAVAAEMTHQTTFVPQLPALFSELRNFYATGLFALGQGYIFTCMVLTAIVIYVIDRDFMKAAAWCLVGAVLSWFGIIHTFSIENGDVIGVVNIPFPRWNDWATGYALMAAIVFSAQWLTVKHDVDPQN